MKTLIAITMLAASVTAAHARGQGLPEPPRSVHECSGQMQFDHDNVGDGTKYRIKDCFFDPHSKDGRRIISMCGPPTEGCLVKAVVDYISYSTEPGGYFYIQRVIKVKPQCGPGQLALVRGC